MQQGRFLFASDSVTEGHPDKLCDRVADAVLDACLAQDPEARAACDACTKAGMVMVLGELETKASVNYEQVIREAVRSLGLDGEEKGLDWRTMNVISAVEERSPDLVQAVAAGGGPLPDSSATIAAPAGGEQQQQQGIAFGYATDETPEMMPLSHMLAARLCARLDGARKDGGLAWLRPEGRAQVTVEYAEAPDGALVPARVHSVAVGAQRVAASDVKQEQAERELLERVVQPSLPPGLYDAGTLLRLAAPAGGAGGRSGLSGRRAGAEDAYGGWAPPSAGGWGAPSGRDGSRLGRAAAYGARWAARSLVAAGLCRRCLVQVGYLPGEAQPASVHVQSYGTGKACGKTDAELTATVLKNFDLRLPCLQRDLGLKAPQFQKLAAYGHFGRTDLELAWEKPKDLH